MKISAIIPVVGTDTLPPGVAGMFGECIVVDGGSQHPGTVEGVRVIRAPRGRALQLNAGAKMATREILLFLHADTKLPGDAADRISQAIEAGAIGGCFETVFDSPHLLFKVGDFWRNFRARHFHHFYGDQSIFIRRDVFEELEGYRLLRMMEDYDLCRRMRRRGRIKYIPSRAVTSARKYLHHGIIRTWLFHQKCKLEFFLTSRKASVGTETAPKG